ncbi:MAG: hypothetical protein E7170_04685 [Firmicutes bacterium]|nr:hypothetical protein [Bacillota bacterium]
MKKILMLLIILLLVGCNSEINDKEEINNNEIKEESKDPIKNTVDTIDNSKKNAAVSSCNAMIRTIRYNSMLYGVNSGSVLDLNINGIKPISGTWSIDSNGNIILSKVVIDGYECNTIDNNVDCFKIN